MKIAELLLIKFEIANFSPTAINRNVLAEKLDETKSKLSEVVKIKNGLMSVCDHVSYSYNSNNSYIFAIAQRENETKVDIQKPAYGYTEQSSGKMNAEQWDIFFRPIEENLNDKINQIEGILKN